MNKIFTEFFLKKICKFYDNQFVERDSGNLVAQIFFIINHPNSSCPSSFFYIASKIYKTVFYNGKIFWKCDWVQITLSKISIP